MTIRSTRDLNEHLIRHSCSPEEIAGIVGISNMTIRRMLKNSPDSPIPKKYWPLFDRLLPSPQMDIPGTEGIGFEQLIAQIENDGSKCKDPNGTLRMAKEKVNVEKLGSGIFSMVRELGRTVKSEKSHKMKALALGALLYFLTPLDLIPDTIPVFGYVDDFAVLSIAVSMIRLKEDKETTKLAK